MTLIGFLNCNKPPGMTSRDVVNVVQRRIRPTKVGHCGTLDPLAHGVLVLGVGPAVRLTSYVQSREKRYVGSFRLGASSATGDLEKGFTEHPDMSVPSIDDLQRACQTLVGTVKQVPPAYSAIWVDGERAYQRARRGEDVEVPSRMVSILQLKVLKYQYPGITLDITCGSGTYIRTLGIDLAKAVGSCAVMTDLNRVRIGPFTIENAVTVEQLRSDPIEQLMTPASIGVNHLPRIVVDQDGCVRLGNGLPLAAESAHLIDETAEEVVAATERGELRAILVPKPRGWCPQKVFPTLGG